MNNPPMASLFSCRHFSTDELFGSWMFALATFPLVPYCLVRSMSLIYLHRCFHDNFAVFFLKLRISHSSQTNQMFSSLLCNCIALYCAALHSTHHPCYLHLHIMLIPPLMIPCNKPAFSVGSKRFRVSSYVSFLSAFLPWSLPLRARFLPCHQ